MIDYLLFDMDNTLYPASSKLGHTFDEKINRYVSDYLNIPWEESNRLRKKSVPVYGTTLNWLIKVHGFKEIDHYMDYIHPKDIDTYVSKTPEVKEMISTLPYRRSVLTNSPIEHAGRVLSHLELENQFEHVFDIRFNRFEGKPFASAYERVTGVIQKEPGTVLLIDDSPSYLEGFQQFGGHGLLVDETGNRGDTGFPVIQRITQLPEILPELITG